MHHGSYPKRKSSLDPIAALILTKVADAFIGALSGKVTDSLLSKLKGDPAKNAFKQAVGNAIQRYGTGERLALARPLKDGLLSMPVVADELAQIVCFEREPNAELIGRNWKTALESPP